MDCLILHRGPSATMSCSTVLNKGGMSGCRATALIVHYPSYLADNLLALHHLGRIVFYSYIAPRLQHISEGATLSHNRATVIWEDKVLTCTPRAIVVSGEELPPLENSGWYWEVMRFVLHKFFVQFFTHIVSFIWRCL